MKTEENCQFCKIRDDKIPSEKIYEDDNTIAFLDINPANKGHTLVIPKNHSTNLYDIDAKDFSAVAKTAKKIAITLKEKLSADGMNLIMNNEPDGGQVIFHPHIHVIPRFKGDGHKNWNHGEYKKGEIENTAKKLRGELS